jgi:hypothetical protein
MRSAITALTTTGVPTSVWCGAAISANTIVGVLLKQEPL